MSEIAAKDAMIDFNCKDLFEVFIPERLSTKPEILKINAVYQFILTEENGGNWSVDLTKPSGQVQAGLHDKPELTLTLSASDFCEMVRGRLDPQAAFMQGRLKLKGDVGLALRLQELLG